MRNNFQSYRNGMYYPINFEKGKKYYRNIYSWDIQVECSLDGVLSVTAALSSESIFFIIISQLSSSVSDSRETV